MTSPPLYLALSAIALFVAAYKAYYRWSAGAMNRIPGPPSNTWIYGNAMDMQRGEAVTTEAEWTAQYGRVLKLKNPLGQNTLLVSDPKAMQYIFQTRAYSFPKPSERKPVAGRLFGSGILMAEGDDHKRQRRVMLPSFSTGESRSFVPIFSHCASQMVNKWNEVMESSLSDNVVINLPHWTGRATLDAIGEAAFGYKFDALEGSGNQLSSAFQKFVSRTFGSQPNFTFLMNTIMQFIPTNLRVPVADLIGGERIRFVQTVADLAKGVAADLVAQKKAAHEEGSGAKDILSLCVQTNSGENTRGKMTEDEMLSQLQTITFAGHETTSTATTWVFYELAKRPEMQERLRAEIQTKHTEKLARGDPEWNWKDFEEMEYLTAIIKETLRFHPLVPIMFRVTATDDVLPLSQPITTTDGEVLHELPIPKGLRLLMSVAMYNRDTTIFGADADTYNPDRWLGGSTKGQFDYSSIGVLANLMTFSGGPKACIGWRFAVLEVQAFVIEMISNFKFEYAVDPKTVRAEASGVMSPVLISDPKKGSQLPLRVTRLSAEL